ncbi:Peptidoglycan/LPS O-acetylase OafA/YrhL, contains acyltransferase and SGNH-hydrolase domains [Capnocytophaga haemolytica]|uniref:Acyltransferase n=1 Tax=Capnocytophaga haemolytica TaxID=45243 RepID=A0AAX2H0W6_9FLAO|nr:acyltransferase [Capnocytophaga haemolytica]AMD85699.1 acyltransferase [Capnocytophaga haemolytica]SFN91002.1 Peptidoglycan/LPS O-acetylase OafA/YrhL, contains acyltransferase and SGNH-hydrolase domains [Capnocytophaga haemolytica]SNV16347.1 Uncharacterized protein conserved in bacteria [Capnocytophaga haemolytica]
MIHNTIESKPHYVVLDALRGVAAFMVLFFHIFESFATSPLDQVINHGYLAVDFFFMLSGFVIAYAYDDRWDRLSVKDFCKRRLIRLQPMVVIGALIGALLFYTQGCQMWDVSQVSIGVLLVAMLLNMLMIPVTSSVEIRGIGEMYPLNGPTWSLFFEYIGNILYALVLRRMGTRVLAIWTVLMAVGLCCFAVGSPWGYLSVGWAMDSTNMLGGSLRLLFAFSCGLLLSRLYRYRGVKHGFLWAALLIVLVTAAPRIGDKDTLWMNGLYDSLVIILVFPCVVLLGASASVKGKAMARVAKFLGDISYPLYMVHYPFIYLYYAWVKNNELTFWMSIHGAIGVVVGSVLLAYLCLKWYDIPVRRWLAGRLK